MDKVTSKGATNSTSGKQGTFDVALAKIASASAASSHAAIQASKATRPSLHTRFVYDPAKGRV